MRGPTPRRLWKYVVQRLRLATYFAAPGDERPAPQIPARAILWGLVIGHILREDAFAGVDALVRGAARALGVGRRFSHDTLAYVTARLDPGPTRAALSAVARRAKRNKALVGSGWIGLAVDGTATTCLSKPGTDCPYCRPLRKEDGTLLGYRHEMAVLSIVNAGVTLPCDLELYGPGDSESAAGQRVLRRGVAALGPRFADYVVGDSKFATAPFLHTAGDVGLRVVARLKDNLPELHAAAQARFVGRMPTATFTDGRDQLEVWDASDFDPWVGLRWKTVRVLKYRQTKPNGKIIEAFWLTDWPVILIYWTSAVQVRNLLIMVLVSANDGGVPRRTPHPCVPDERCVRGRAPRDPGPGTRVPTPRIMTVSFRFWAPMAVYPLGSIAIRT